MASISFRRKKTGGDDVRRDVFNEKKRGIVENLGTISKRITSAARVAAALVASGRRPRLNSRLLSFGGLRTRSAGTVIFMIALMQSVIEPYYRRLIRSGLSPRITLHVHNTFLARDTAIRQFSIGIDPNRALDTLSSRVIAHPFLENERKLRGMETPRTEATANDFYHDLGQRESFVVPRLPS